MLSDTTGLKLALYVCSANCAALSERYVLYLFTYMGICVSRSSVRTDNVYTRKET